MSNHYDGLRVTPVGFDFGAGDSVDLNGAVTLTGMDVLGIIQAAFDDLGANSPLLVAVKRDVLDLVADGNYAHALRAAIVGAGTASRHG